MADSSTQTLTITDTGKWILRQQDTERVEFAIDATNGASPAEGTIVALNTAGKGVVWGSKSGDPLDYTYEPYGLLMSTADFTTTVQTLSVLTMGMVDKRRIYCAVAGGLVNDALAGLRKNNIIVKECE